MVLNISLLKNGLLNLDGEFDRPPTVGRERWDEYDNEAPTQMNK